MNPTSQTFLDTVRQGTLSDTLHYALDHGHIYPAFQPIVDIRSRATVGFEILSRWIGQDGGQISPLSFIPPLQEHGLLDTLFDSLVRRACQDAVAWQVQCFLAFNVSPMQIVNDSLPQRIVDLSTASRFPLKRLQLEVTEGALLLDDDRAHTLLAKLDELGIKIAIDDFGTAYSNLARLENFPFRKLKIDARFVHDLHLIPSRRRIVAAIISLGHNLGIPVVAEGVEVQEEEDVLRKLGCNLGQGWLYGKPRPASEVDLACLMQESAEEDFRPNPLSPFEQFHQLSTLYAQSPVGLSFLDLAYTHVRASKRFAAMHGRTPEELEGKTIYDILEGEDLRRAEIALRNAALSGGPVREAYSLLGREYMVFASCVYDIGEELIGYSIVAIDVTEHTLTKNSLIRYEQYYRQSSTIHLNVVWAADAEGKMVYIGPSFLDAPTDTVQDRIKKWPDYIYPKDRERLDAEWAKCHSEGRDFKSEVRIRKPDGNYIWLRSQASVSHDENGEILYWCGVLWELSDIDIKHAALETKHGRVAI